MGQFMIVFTQKLYLEWTYGVIGMDNYLNLIEKETTLFTLDWSSRSEFHDKILSMSISILVVFFFMLAKIWQ